MDAAEEVCLRDLVGLGGGEPRCTEYTGTQALMLAVLELGIRDYCAATGYEGTDADRWVRSNRRGPFSFTVICESLGLDPSAVRQALLRLKNGSARPFDRVRPRSRKKRPTANAP